MRQLVLVLLLSLALTSAQEQLIWEEEFDVLNETTWQHFVTGWCGNHEFQYYRNNRKNSYVRDGVLYLHPTLTADEYGNDFLYEGEIDLWGEGCEEDMNSDGGCIITANSDDIVDPIQSARLRTKYSFGVMYGRVEVRAMLPRGDWLWPAIWMLPTNNDYGGWPRSGEIDIMEAKGNELLICNGELEGHQKAASTMHWGPDSGHNGYPQTHWSRHDEQNPFGSTWHLYGLEWDEEGMKFTMDSVEIGAVNPPDGGFWQMGGFEGENLWADGTKMAPFDREFYFVLNNAVGGNYFPDGCDNGFGDKPWYGNNVPGAQTSFWEAKDVWYPTWNGEDAALKVDYIRVWQNVSRKNKD